MPTQTLTVPTHAAVRITKCITELGYQTNDFAHTKLFVSEDTLKSWCDGSLQITTSQFMALCEALELSSQVFVDDWDELFKAQTKHHILWRLLFEEVTEEGSLSFVAKNENALENLMACVRPTPLPYANHLKVIKLSKDNELTVRVTPKCAENFRCVISQSLSSALHTDLARISMVTGKTVLSALSHGKNDYAENHADSFHLVFPHADQTTVYISSDDQFCVEVLDSCRSPDALNVPVIHNIGDLFTV